MKRANYATALNELAKAVRDIADKKNVSLEDAGCAIVAETVLKKLKAREIAGLLTLQPTALAHAAQSINRQLDRIAAGRIACLLALVSGEENPDPATMLGRGERLIEMLAVANRPENYSHRWPDPTDAVREHLLFKDVGSVAISLPEQTAIRARYSLRRLPGGKKTAPPSERQQQEFLCLISDRSLFAPGGETVGGAS